MTRFGGASRRMDYVGLLLLSVMMVMLWVNSTLAADGSALAQPDPVGAERGDDGGLGSVDAAGVELI